MIDWDRLNMLKTDIGEEDFADVAFLFVAEITEHLERISQNSGSVSGADFHFLRGSASNLGFTALADACQTAETACKSALVPDVVGIQKIFQASLAAVAGEIPELAAA